MAQAERDLELSRWAAKGEFFEWACFSAQPAAEKAVKALYQALHGEGRGHMVGRLLAALPQEVRPGEAIIQRALRLDRYYLPTRYPNGFESGSPKDYFMVEDAEESIEDASQIINFCRGQLP